MAGEIILAIPIIYAVVEWAMRKDPKNCKPTKERRQPPPEGIENMNPQPRVQPPPPERPPYGGRGDIVQIGDDIYEMRKVGRR